jgi:Flp pilus assembly protein TadD
VCADGPQANPQLARLRFLVLKNLAPLQGKTQAALETYVAATKLDPSDPLLWVDASRVAAALGFLGPATYAAQQALQAAPGHTLVQEWLVLLRAAQADWQGAGQEVLGLQAMEPSHPW